MRRVLPIAAVAACLLAAPAQAAKNLELAVQDDAVLVSRSYSDAQLALERAQAMGAKRIRVNLHWATSMPSAQATAASAPRAVQWDFERVLRLLDDVEQRGIALQVTLMGPAPAWATRSGRVGNNAPNPGYYARFVRAAVRALDGRVDRWSVWNEPNWHSQLSPYSKAPVLYRGLYQAAYRAIVDEQPDAEILIGELMPGANSTHSMPALQFLRGVTCSRRDWSAAKRCAPLEADGFALHPYNFARTPSKATNPNPDIVEMGSLSRLERALDRLRARHALETASGARMPLFLTEFGFHTSGPLAVTASQHARWLTDAWRIAKRDPRVRQLLQYELIDPWPKSVTWRSAVLKRNGDPTPAYDALRRLALGI